jgi:hypothetical protein
MEEKDLQRIIEAMSGLSKDEINSIEISKTAKGDYSWKIKVYYPPDKGDQISNADKTIKQIQDINAKLRSTFG